MQQFFGPSDLAETIGIAVVGGTAVAVALAASAKGLAGAVDWIRHWRGGRARERLFVGRWGDLGPELYLVGKSVRRLPGARGNRHPCEDEPLDFARRMLAEVMHCRPATQLARAFAERLEPFPADGFVLSATDVEAWLDERPGAAADLPDESSGGSLYL